MTNATPTPADGVIDAQTRSQLEQLARHPYGGKFSVYMSVADARTLLSLATPSPGKAPEPVAWRHEIVEPTGQHLTLYSASGDNPWSHWLGQYRDECRYTATPLYASPGKAEAEDAALHLKRAHLIMEMCLRHAVNGWSEGIAPRDQCERIAEKIGSYLKEQQERDKH